MAEFQESGEGTTQGPIQDTNSISNQDAFIYEPVNNLQLPPDLDIFNEDLDPQFLSNIKQVESALNRIVPPYDNNVNSPYPGAAGPTYNPFNSSAGNANPNNSFKSQISSSIDDVISGGDARITNPIYSNRKATSFDRYSHHPKFNDLGFFPYADNETYYNENSTRSDDFARMSSQYGKLFTPGFISGYRSIGDLFDEDRDYITGADILTAQEFEDATMIGNSTREGSFHFWNNLALQSAYTMGIITNIAVEDAAMAVATRGRSLIGPKGVKLLPKLKNLGRSIMDMSMIGRTAKATRNMLKNLNNADRAKGFYQTVKTGGNFVADLLTPNTARAFRSFNTTKNSAGMVSDMAKISKTFGGFYKDARALNYAVSESKMEGGFVYNRTLANGLMLKELEAEAEGRSITELEVENVLDAANKASQADVFYQIPVIYFSNAILFKTAFSGFNRTMARLAGQNIGTLGRRMAQTGSTFVKKGGKVTGIRRNVFSDVGETFTGIGPAFKRIRAAGIKGGAFKAGQVLLGYTTANFSEGLQELYQEGLAVATENYYLTKLADPSVTHNVALNSAVKSGIDSQMSAQGLEVFMSGFLMGTTVAVPQKVMFQTIPNLFQRVTDPAGYKAAKDKVDNYVKNSVDAINNSWNKMADDPAEFFDARKLNISTQFQASKDIIDNITEEDLMGFQDTKDEAVFANIVTALEKGSGNSFREVLIDLNQLSDEELANAVGDTMTEEEKKNGKSKDRLNSMINRFDRLDNKYERLKNEYPKKYDSSKYVKGTPEYIIESLREKAEQHALNYSLFLDDSFIRATERMQSMYNLVESFPVLKDNLKSISARDLTLLLDKQTFQLELKSLRDEVSLLESIENKDSTQNDLLKDYNEKIAVLESIQDILYDEKNLTRKDEGGYFSKKNKKKLIKPITNYLNVLAKQQRSFADNQKVEELIDIIIDHEILSVRAAAFNRAIEFLTDPQAYDRFVMDSFKVFQNIFSNARNYFETAIKDFVFTNEVNGFLNGLSQLGIYVQPEELKLLNKTKDVSVIQTFITETGILSEENNPGGLYDIAVKFRDGLMTLTEEAKEETEEAEEAEESIVIEGEEELINFLKDSNIDAGFRTTNSKSNVFYDKIINKLYRAYSKLEVDSSRIPEQKSKWLSRNTKYLLAYTGLKNYWISRIKPSQSNQDLDKGFDSFLSKFAGSEILSDIFRITDVDMFEFNITAIEEATPAPKTETTTENINTLLKSKSVSEIIENFTNTNLDFAGKENLLKEDLEFFISQYENTKEDVEEFMKTQGSTLIKEVYRKDEKSFFKMLAALKQTSKVETEVEQTPAPKTETTETITPEIVLDDDGTPDINEINFSSNPELEDEEEEPTKTSGEIIDEGELYNLKRIEIDPGVFIFTIEDKKGNKLTDDNLKSVGVNSSQDGVFQTLIEARSAFGIVNDTDDTFTFGNLELYQGARVKSTASRGKTYLVYSSKSDMRKRNAKIILILDDQNAANKIQEVNKGNKKNVLELTQKDFRNNYVLAEDFAVVEVPKNASKLRTREAVTFYPHKITTDGKKENIETAVARTQAILNALSKEDLSKLVIRVKANPDYVEGSTGKYKTAKYDKDGKDISEENPLIEKLSEKLSIEVIVPDELLGKVNAAIDNIDSYIATLEPNVASKIDSIKAKFALQDNILGYLPNNNIQLIDFNGNKVLPLDMTENLFKRVFNYFGSAKKQMSETKNNFKAQGALLDYINKNIDNIEQGITLGELEKAGFNLIKNSTFRYLTQPIEDRKPLSELSTNTFDGSIVIMENTRRAGKIVTRLLSDRKGPTRSKQIFLSKVENQLRATGQYKLFQSKGRYVAVIKTDENTFTAVELIPKSLDNITIEGIITDIFSRAVETRKKNFKNDEILDNAFNTIFNNETLPSRFYIATARGYSVEIKVTNNGDVALALYDKEFGLEVEKISIPYSQVIRDLADPKTKEFDGKTRTDVFKEFFKVLNTAIQNRNAAIKNDKKADPKLKKALEKASKLDLGIDSIRESFAENTTVSKLVSSTVQNLDPRVRFDFTLLLKADGTKQSLDAGSKFIQAQFEEISKNENKEVEETNDSSAVNKQNEAKKALQNKLEQLNGQIKKLKGTLTRKELRGNQELQRLIAQRNKTISDINKLNTANKVLITTKDLIGDANSVLPLTEDFSNHVDDMNEFNAFLKRTMPSFISVESIDTLTDNMTVGQMRVGAFAIQLKNIAEGIKSTRGIIYTGVNSPYKYHESFHGIFRMLLTTEEQERLIAAGRKRIIDAEGQSGLDQRIQVQMYNSFSTLTTDEEKNNARAYAEILAIEEFIADEFQKFKVNPKSANVSSETKSFFTRIIEFIKKIFSARKGTGKDIIQSLFEDIDSGKFRNYSIADNEFTNPRNIIIGVTNIANKIIRISENKILNQDLAIEVQLGMARRALDIYEQDSIEIEDAIEQAYDEYFDLYDPQSEKWNYLSADQKISLEELSIALEEQEVDIISGVTDYLNAFGFELEVDEEQSDEDEIGLKNIDQYDKDPSLLGGLVNAPKKVRAYLSTISATKQDFFGNSELKDGVPIRIPIDPNVGYTGVIKAAKNTTDFKTILQRIYYFGQESNENTKAIQEQIFEDYGIVWEGQDGLSNGVLTYDQNKSNELNLLIKTFINFAVPYLQVQIDSNNNSVVYDAFSADDAKSQIDKWRQAYSRAGERRRSPDGKAEILRELNILSDLVSGELKDRSSEPNLEEDTVNISNVIQEYLGIKLAPAFLKFSILKNKIEQATYTKADDEFIQAFEGQDPLSYEDVRELIISIETEGTKDAAKSNLFAPRKVNLDEEEDSGSRSRIKIISLKNAVFDESIGLSTFKNAEDNLVYGHQIPTYEIEATELLNDVTSEGSVIDDVRESSPFLSRNYLLKNPFFKAMSATGKIILNRLSGLKYGGFNVNEEGALETGRSAEGRTYGKLTPEEFAKTIISIYKADFNAGSGKLKNIIIDKVGGRTAVAPALSRVLESANNGNTITLPVIKAVEKTIESNEAITLEALNAFITNIEIEFESIQRESNPKTRDSRLIPGFNSDSNGQQRQEYIEILDDDGNLVDVKYNRAFRFYKSENILSPQKSVVEDTTGTVEFKNNGDQVERIRSGNQTLLVYKESDAKKIGHSLVNSTRKALLSDGKEGSNKTMHSVKLLNIYDKIESDEARDELRVKFGPSIVEKEDDNFKYPIKIGSILYYTDNVNILNLFRRSDDNKGKYAVYEVIDNIALDDVSDELVYGQSNNITDLEVGLKSSLSFERELLDPFTENKTATIYAVFLVNKALRIQNDEMRSNLATEASESVTSDLDKVNKKINAELKTRDNIDDKAIEEINKAAMEEAYNTYFEDNQDQLRKLINSKTKIKSNSSAKLEKLALSVIQDMVDLQKRRIDDKKRVSDKHKDGFAIELAALARAAGESEEFISLQEALSSMNSSIQELRAFVNNRLEAEFRGFLTQYENTITEEESWLNEGLKTIEGLDNEDTALSNSLLNLKSGERIYNIKQIFLNNWINVSSWNQIVHGNQAMLFSNAVEEVKRAKLLKNGGIKSIESPLTDPSAGIDRPLDSISAIVHTDTFGKSKHSNKDVESQDGQLYITIKGMIYSYFGLGKLTPSMKKLANKIRQGETFTREDYFGAAEGTDKDTDAGFFKLKSFVNSQKFAYTDGQTTMKMSISLLSSDLTRKDGRVRPSMRPLDNVRLKAERFEEEQDVFFGKNTIVVVGPMSAFKTLKFNIVPHQELYGASELAVTEEGVESNVSYIEPLSSDDVMELDPKYFGLQMENPSSKTEVPDASQIKALITGEQDDKVEVTILGSKFTVSEIRKAYNFAQGQRHLLSYGLKRNTLFSFDIGYALDELHKSYKKGRITENLASFLLYAEQSLIASQSSGQMVNFFSSESIENRTVNLNNSMTRDKFESLLLSYFKAGMDAKIPGDSAALLSDYGRAVVRIVYAIDEKGIPFRSEVVREDVAIEKYGLDFLNSIPNINEGGYDIGDDRNISESLLGVPSDKEGVLNEPAIIYDRLRTDVRLYEDPTKEETYRGLRATEIIGTIKDKASYDITQNLVDITADEVESEFQRYIRSSQYSPKAGENIVRIEIPDFDVSRGRKEFATFKGYRFREDADGTVSFLTQSASIPKVIKEAFATRIPSQAHQSAINGVFVDYMPAYYGSTVMTAREIIEVAGSDFDIDKLYMQMKKYFEENGVLIEYGNTFSHYVRFINDAVNNKSESYGQALYRAKKDNITIPDAIAKYNEDLDFKFSNDALKALIILGAPITEENFNNHLEKHKIKLKGKEVKMAPYSAAMDNVVLDLKLALQSNEGVTQSKQGELPIAYTPADIDAFQEEWNSFEQIFKDLAKITNEDDLDTDNAWGQLRAWINNKGASIGTVVLPNTYLSIMREYNIKMQKITLKVGNQTKEINRVPRFNGVDYGDFGDANEKLDSNGRKGRRVQELISSIITLMTDDAKHRLSGKFRLNKKASAVVVTLLAQSVPLKTALYLINDPIVAYSIQESIRKGSKQQNIIASKVFQLLEAFPNIKDPTFKSDNNKQNEIEQEIFRQFGYIPVKKLSVTNDLMKGVILKNKVFTTKEDLSDMIEDGQLTENDALAMVNILNQYLKSVNISDFTRDLASLINVGKGFGSNIVQVQERKEQMVDLGLFLSDSDRKKLDPKDRPLYDLSPLMKNSYLGMYADIFENFDSVVLPELLLTKTEEFENIIDSVIQTSDPSSAKRNRSQIYRDLVSYLTIKAYIQKIGYENETDSRFLSGLNNEILYDPEKNIVKSINNAIEYIRNNDDISYNSFLEEFVITYNAMDVDNKKGQNTYKALMNTFSKITDYDRVTIQDDLQRLFEDDYLRSTFYDVIHYIMVKDGLQAAFGTLRGVLSPTMLNEYLEASEDVFQAFKNPQRANFNAIFGLTYDELLDNFLTNYAGQIKSSKFAKPIASLKNKVGSIRIYNNSRKYSTAARDITPEYVRDNPDTIFVIPDNAKGIGENSVYSKIRSEDNVRVIPIKKDVGTEESDYYTNDDINSYTEELDKIMSEIETLAESENVKVIIPKFFISSRELAKWNSNTGLEIKQELIKALENRLFYKLSLDGKNNLRSQGSITDEGKSFTKANNDRSAKLLGEANTAIKKDSAYIDASMSTPRLIIDVYKGIRGAAAKVSNTNARGFIRIPASKKGNNNLSKILGYFRGVGFKSRQVTKGKNTYTEFSLPAFIKIPLDSNSARKFTYFKLEKFRSVGFSKQSNNDILFDKNFKEAIGNYAEYVEVDLLGSTDGNAVAFAIPGDIKTYNDYIKTYESAQSVLSNELNIDALVEGGIDFDSLDWASGETLSYVDGKVIKEKEEEKEEKVDKGEGEVVEEDDVEEAVVEEEEVNLEDIADGTQPPDGGSAFLDSIFENSDNNEKETKENELSQEDKQYIVGMYTTLSPGVKSNLFIDNIKSAQDLIKRAELLLEKNVIISIDELEDYIDNCFR